MANNTLNTTQLMTGKDGRLSFKFDGDAEMTFLAEVANFAVNMTVNTTQVQPVGAIVVSEVPTGVAFELTYEEMVVRDDVDMAPMLKAIKNGKIPVYHFQGALERPDGVPEIMGFNNAVPKGTFGLMNVTPGEIIKRPHAFALNSVPEFIKELATSKLYTNEV